MNYKMGLAFMLLGIGFFIISISKTLDQIRNEDKEFKAALFSYLFRMEAKFEDLLELQLRKRK